MQKKGKSLWAVHWGKFHGESLWVFIDALQQKRVTKDLTLLSTHSVSGTVLGTSHTFSSLNLPIILWGRCHTLHFTEVEGTPVQAELMLNIWEQQCLNS